MADPSNVLAVDDIAIMTGREVRAVVASPEDVAALIQRLNRLGEAVAEAIEEEEQETGPTEIADLRESADDAPVIKLVHSIIAQAVEHGASDIHFEPEEREDARALPHRRRALVRDDGPQADDGRGRLAHQDHGRPRHRRAAHPAGRPRLARPSRAAGSTSASSRCPASTASRW